MPGFLLQRTHSSYCRTADRRSRWCHSAGDRERHGDRDDGESARNHRLSLRTDGRQRPLCHGAVAGRCHANYCRRHARVAANQRRDLHADGDAAEYCSHPNPSERIMSQLDYPFHFDTRGRTAETSEDEHIRDLIEQVLFTAPGERVNRPTFGCGLMQLVFAPNSDALAATSQFLVQGALQQWLGDLIVVESVQVEADDSTLRVSIQYLIRRTQTRQTAEFARGGLGA